jgi:hypothetical protein
MCCENRGQDEGRNFFTVDGVVVTNSCGRKKEGGGQSVSGSEDTGTAAAVLEKGTLDRSGREEGVGLTQVLSGG